MCDESDVVVGPRLVLRRDLVRAQERGHDVDGVRVVETLDDAQLPQLRLERQAVAALRFAGRRAVTGHLVEPRSRGGYQLVFGRRPGRGHGLQNAAAFGRDLRVRRASEPALQFLAPVAGKDEMGVRIDETRNDAAAARIDPYGVGRDRDVAVQRVRGPDEDDRAVGGGNRRAPKRSDVSLARAALRGGPRARRDEVGVLDEEVGASHESSRVLRARAAESSVRAAWSSVTPVTATRLRRLWCPDRMLTARCGTPRRSARMSITSAFAAPSTGGA